MSAADRRRDHRRDRPAWPLDADAEITLEANPTSVEAERFRGYRAAGVNRVSLGVQALNDADLKRSAARHSVAEAIAALDARRRRFRALSFDLIYARPGTDRRGLAGGTARRPARAREHLSLYQLTIEPGHHVRAAARRRQARRFPTTSAALFTKLPRSSRRGGPPGLRDLQPRPAGRESRHNLVYWRYRDYVGVGPGAHGRFSSAAKGRLAQETGGHPEMWLTLVESEGNGLVESVPL